MELHLVHHTLLSVAIGILHRVQAVQKTRLLVCGRGRAAGAVIVGRAGPGGTGGTGVVAASGVDTGVKLVLEVGGSATGVPSGAVVPVVASGAGHARSTSAARASETSGA